MLTKVKTNLWSTSKSGSTPKFNQLQMVTPWLLDNR